MNTVLLTVYGTLKDQPGFDYLGDVELNGKLFHFGEFPGAVDLGDPDNTFSAHVYSIPEYFLDTLDVYEGVEHGLYRRDTIDTPYGKSYIYIFNQAVPEGALQIQEWR